MPGVEPLNRGHVATGVAQHQRFVVVVGIV